MLRKLQMILVGILVLPSWLMGLNLRPVGHPDRKNFPKFRMWIKGATVSNVILGLILWAGVAYAIYNLILFHKYNHF